MIVRCGGLDERLVPGTGQAKNSDADSKGAACSFGGSMLCRLARMVRWHKRVEPAETLRTFEPVGRSGEARRSSPGITGAACPRPILKGSLLLWNATTKGNAGARYGKALRLR